MASSAGEPESSAGEPEPAAGGRQGEDEVVPERPRDDEDPGRSLWRGLVTLAILVVLAASLLLAVPGLRGVGRVIAHMRPGWVAAGVGLEILSCLGYVLAFLQVFERVPLRLGARVALSELAFGAAVSIGGAGSVAVGAWLLVERGGDPTRVAERSAVLFLLTSAINVFTLILAGLGLYLGVLPGPRNALLSLVPAIVGVLLLELATTIRMTEAILFRLDWRIVGAIAYLWCDIAVLAVCFAAAGHVPPLAVIVLAYQIGYMSNVIPVPGGIGVLDGSMVGMFALYGIAATATTAATIVYHAISLWIPAMWGTAAFVILRRSRNEPIALRPPRRVRAQRRRERRARRRAHRIGV